ARPSALPIDGRVPVRGPAARAFVVLLLGVASRPRSRPLSPGPAAAAVAQVFAPRVRAVAQGAVDVPLRAFSAARKFAAPVGHAWPALPPALPPQPHEAVSTPQHRVRATLRGVPRGVAERLSVDCARNVTCPRIHDAAGRLVLS